MSAAVALVFACAESGRDYRDGAAVLQVVQTRAKLNRRGWARYDGTLSTALWSPGQHAHDGHAEHPRRHDLQKKRPADGKRRGVGGRW